MGCQCYPQAKKLLITADGGGSNGYRVKLWKVELQKQREILEHPSRNNAIVSESNYYPLLPDAETVLLP